MNETELLFTEILNCDRASLYLNKDLALTKEKSSRIASILKRRILGEPIQYILGKTEFMGLEFKLTPDVLIPRPETEILVETVLKVVYGVQSREYSANILDVGTGSGCIAVSLAKYISGCKIDALDISSGALEVAVENAHFNRVKINFFPADLFNSIHLKPANYDIIVSNPPYIASGQLQYLQPEINHEPAIALDGGIDGLDFYRRIIKDSPRYLKEEGCLVIEIGFQQKEAVEEIFQKSPAYQIIEVIKDYHNIERVVVAKKYG